MMCSQVAVGTVLVTLLLLVHESPCKSPPASSRPCLFLARNVRAALEAKVHTGANHWSQMVGGEEDPAPAAASNEWGRGAVRMCLRGGGIDEDGGGGAGMTGINFEEGDSGLDEQEMLEFGDEADATPWPMVKNMQEEEKKLAQSVKDGGFVLGKDKWYDDMYSSVGKNSKGVVDSFHDEEEGHEENYNTQYAEEWKDESNEEGYLGEATEDMIAHMYPALKERFKWYERNVTLRERHSEHQLRVGDLVTLSPKWREWGLGNYTSNKGLPDVPSLDEINDVPFNDADDGPLYPEDVGIIMQDDESTKPYRVKAFNSVCYRAGFPYEWTDEWWYIPEALQKHTPPKHLRLADDATVRVPEHFPSVKLALVNMTEGQSLHVLHGDHRFEDVIEMGEHPQGTHPAHKLLKIRTLNMQGGEGARSWGRMLMGRFARGHLRQMCLMYTTLNSVRGVVELHGGPWVLDECEIRAAGCIAVRMLTEGNMTASRCGLGGFAWPISVNTASDAVRMEADTCARLTACTLDMTGRLGGCGLYACERARAILVGCLLTQSDHAVGYNDECTIKMYGCSMHGNRNEAFYGGVCSLKSTLVLSRNRVDGPVWFRGRLPAYLGLRGEYPGDNIMGPIPAQRRWAVEALNITMPLLDDRIQHRARLTVPVHWDGEHR